MFSTGWKSEHPSCAGWEREAAELNPLEVSPPDFFGVEGKRNTRQKEDKNFAEGRAPVDENAVDLDSHNTGILVPTGDQKFKVFDIISQLLSGLEPGFIGLIFLEQSAQSKDICRVI